VYDVPLLVETRQASAYDVVVVVEAPRALRIARLEARGLPRPDTEQRMAAQADDEQRRAVATHVLDNSGTLEALRTQVDQLWDTLLASA
jgi:dephospho-CoA kinase